MFFGTPVISKLCKCTCFVLKYTNLYSLFLLKEREESEGD